MASTTISGSGTRNNGGTSVGVTSTSTMNGLSVRNTASNHQLTGTESKLDLHTESILRNTAVAITAITQSASTGKVNIAKSSHGLVVGDKIMVAAADVAVYNRVHQVVTVTDANNVKTNVAYTTDTVSVHGSYYTVAGSLNKMTAGKYVARIVNTELAGVASTLLRSGASDHGNYYSPLARGSRRVGIDSWSYTTGVPTFNSNRGSLTKYHNISQNDDNLAVETGANTRSVPGRVTFRVGSAPTTSSTPRITG